MDIHEALLIALFARAQGTKARASITELRRDIDVLCPEKGWAIARELPYLVGRGWVRVIARGGRGVSNSAVYELATTPPYTVQIEGKEWHLHGDGLVTRDGFHVDEYEQLRNVALGTAVGLWLRAIGRAELLLKAR